MQSFPGPRPKTPSIEASPSASAPAPKSSLDPRAVYFVSLGCPKNRVDTEVMLGLAERAGCHVAHDPAQADVIVVNTCGFLASAEKESIDTILEMARYKEEGRCQKLVMAGCLVSRHAAQLERELPEVDHFLGSGDLAHLAEVLDRGELRSYVDDAPRYLYDDSTPRVITGGRHSVYVKLSEGCDRACSFCIIPQLRGAQRSRAIDSMVREIEAHARAGAREVCLIGQELTAYGRDLEPRVDLASLLRALGKADAPSLRWIRLLYTYPTGFPDALIDAIAEEPRVAKYVDVPLQHVADDLLRRMRRGYKGADVRKLVERLRARLPKVALRTTLIVGFPGETDADFRELVDFVKWAELDHVGCFAYSQEQGTVAADLGDQVPDEVKEARRHELMQAQRKISRRLRKSLVGQELDILVDGLSGESDLLLEGRHEGQAPEVDGVVLLAHGAPDEFDDESLIRVEHGGKAREPAEANAWATPGRLVRAKITRAGDYDLVAEILRPA